MNISDEIKDKNIEQTFPPAKKSKGKTERKNIGIILGFFFMIANRISKKLKESFLGYLCSDLYSSINRAWTSGAIYGLLKGKGRIRTGFARLCERSLISRILSSLSDALIQMWVRIFGVAMFSFSFVTVFITLVRYYLVSYAIQENIVLGLLLAVISIPLLTSKKRVGEALLDGRLSGYLMTKILCVDESRYERDDTRSGGSYALAFTWSALLGLLTYFISPLVFVQIIVVLALFALVMCYPELGITLVLGVMPFSNLFERPSVAMLILVVFSLLGFISKYIRGKRVAKIEIIDLAVMIFGALILLGGIFTCGGEESLASAALYFVFLMMYLLVVNSYIRKTWIYRGIKLTVVMTSIMAMLGILQGGITSGSWVDMDIFSDIGGRVTSLLENPNMLGAYLVIVFPLVIAQMIVSKKKLSKALYVLCIIAVLVCTVMTWSRGAWLGMIVSVLLFLVIYDFRNIWLIAAGAATAPAWVYLIPDTVIRRLFSVFEMSDSSIAYRFSTWDGVLRMIGDHIIGGIGVGESAFHAMYPMYSSAGTESVAHSHSLLLQITLELGIIGAVVFAVIMIMYAQKCFIGIKIRGRESKSRAMIAAGLSGICGALVMGITDHIWYNYRVFLVFWAIAGLTMALVRINENENEKENAATLNGVRAVDLDLYY